MGVMRRVGISPPLSERRGWSAKVKAAARLICGGSTDVALKAEYPVERFRRKLAHLIFCGMTHAEAHRHLEAFRHERDRDDLHATIVQTLTCQAGKPAYELADAMLDAVLT